MRSSWFPFKIQYAFEIFFRDLYWVNSFLSNPPIFPGLSLARSVFSCHVHCFDNLFVQRSSCFSSPEKFRNFNWHKFLQNYVCSFSTVLMTTSLFLDLFLSTEISNFYLLVVPSSTCLSPTFVWTSLLVQNLFLEICNRDFPMQISTSPLFFSLCCSFFSWNLYFAFTFPSKISICNSLWDAFICLLFLKWK